MKPESKSHLVAERLRVLIDQGEIPAGALLRQRTVAEDFGVSATPVREALSRLEAEGYLVAGAHGRAAVVRPQEARLWENALIRASLEGLGARLAAERADEDDLAELRMSESEFLMGADGAGRAGELNRRFHFRIYEAARSPMLLSQLQLLWRSLGPGPHVFRDHAESARQHTAIREAIEARDEDAAEALTRRHVMETAQHWQRNGAASDTDGAADVDASSDDVASSDDRPRRQG